MTATELRSHEYAPGSYSPTLQIIVPGGCTPITLSLEVEKCPPECLEPGDVEVVVSPDCIAGTRSVTFNFPGIFTGDLDFGDGTPIAGFTGSSLTHPYSPPGPYTATLTIEGCPPIEIPVGPLEECPIPCPSPGDIGIAIADECNDDGTRDVTFTLPGTFDVTVNFGDGSAPLTLTGASITHPYLPPGPYTASFEFTAIADCVVEVGVGPLNPCPGGPTTGACCLPDGSCVEVTERECRTRGGTYQGDGTSCEDVECPGGNGDGDGGPSACGAFTFVIAALLAVALGTTLVVVTLQSCLGVPVPPWIWGIIAGLWIAVGIAIALSYILCVFGFCPCLSRCDWLAISWIVSLAGSIVAAFLAGCCPVWMWIVAAGLFAAALAIFFIWLGRCEPGTCQILDNLTLAVVTGAGAVLSYLLLLPPIAACGNTSIEVAAGIVGGLLAAAAVTCHGTSD